ncbi:divergent polysaccharide deacetylase family protein [Shewanella sp. Isolate11]|uniref:divergent polysaccharide deacetylase family protein n=1 Tax=Shewanella sp. Isolate11 TaxID=2908530 RepID=UPI001EFC81BA|nr:divergent polysaccharide deacetylase family protein [Shewanella sp. Isolate11]
MRLLLLLAFSCFINQATAAQVSIIIDDIGYRLTDEAVLSLPSSVTLSVLPHTPLGKKIAIAANRKGHEIMLHLPMQALNGKTLGPGGLTNQMDEEQFKNTINNAFDSIPNVRGVNNHMGSLLTQLEQPMTWLMQSLKQHDNYFVDSVTTRFSKAAQTAQQQGIPILRREIFLDNDVSEQALEKQFKRAINFAKTQGYVVMIGHPYPETIEFLNKNLSRLNMDGISLVKTSALLPYRIAQEQPKSGNNKLM